MTAILLYIGRGHEGGADQQEHGGLVLPVIGGVEQRAAEHAVAQDGAGRDQRDRCKHDDDAVEDGEAAIERRREACACGSVRLAVTIRKRTVDHAETSEASLSKFAAVAVL